LFRPQPVPSRRVAAPSLNVHKTRSSIENSVTVTRNDLDSGRVLLLGAPGARPGHRVGDELYLVRLRIQFPQLE